MKAHHQQLPPNPIGAEKLAFAPLHAGNGAGRPFGWMSPKGWTSTLQVLHRHLGIKSVHAPSADYTDAYIGS